MYIIVYYDGRIEKAYDLNDLISKLDEYVRSVTKVDDYD